MSQPAPQLFPTRYIDHAQPTSRKHADLSVIAQDGRPPRRNGSDTKLLIDLRDARAFELAL
jgi:hypothetical protein